MKIKSAKGKGSTFFIAVPDERGRSERRDAEARRRPAAEAEPAVAVVRPGVRACACCWRTITRSCGRVWRRCWAKSTDIEVVGEAANGREAVDLADGCGRTW